MKTLLHLSPALTLLGVPLLIAGTLIYQKGRARQQRAITKSTGCGGPLHRGRGTARHCSSCSAVSRSRWTSACIAGLSGAINISTLLAAAWVLRVPALHVLLNCIWRCSSWSAAVDVAAFTSHPHAAAALDGLLVAQAIIARYS